MVITKGYNSSPQDQSQEKTKKGFFFHGALRPQNLPNMLLASEDIKQKEN